VHEVRLCQVKIAQGGADVAMAQQPLQGMDIHTRFQRMSRIEFRGQYTYWEFRGQYTYCLTIGLRPGLLGASSAPVITSSSRIKSAQPNGLPVRVCSLIKSVLLLSPSER